MAASSAVLLAGAVLAVAGAWQIGVTVDETFHVQRLRNFFDHGWYLLDDDLGGDGTPGSWVVDTHVYAPVTGLLLHLGNVALGIEQWGEVSSSQTAYAVRHVGVASIAAVGVAATGVLGWLVSGRRSWGIVAAAVLVSVPVWTGHSMFNVKDVSVATGYVLVTLGCALAVTGDRHRWGVRAAGVACLAGGLVLAVGTRPGMWVGLGATVGSTLLVLLLGRATRWTGDVTWRLGDVVVAVAVGWALLSVIYPQTYLHPFTALLASATESANYPGESFRGAIPGALAVSVPTLLLMLAAVGNLARLAAWWPRRSSWGAHEVVVALVVLQTVLVPVLMVVKGTAVHGGLRHVLFAVPTFSILVVGGLTQVLQDVGGRVGRQAVCAVGALAMVLPVAAQVQVFPYGYAHAVPAADALDKSPAADPWQASVEELAATLPPDGFVVCGFQVDPEGRPLRQMPNGGQSWVELGEDCRREPLGVLSPYAAEPSGGRTGASFVAVSVYPDEVPTGCTRLGDVSRSRNLTEVVLSVAWQCPLVLPDYEGAVVLRGDGLGAEHLLGGWEATGGDESVAVEGSWGTLGFRVPGTTEAPVLEVEGVASATPRFVVDNVPAVAVPVEGGWRVTPAAGATGVGSPDQHVVSVGPADGGQVRVSGIRVVPGAASQRP